VRGGRGTGEPPIGDRLPLGGPGTGSRLGRADRFGSVRFPRDHGSTMRTDRLVCLSASGPPIRGRPGGTGRRPWR